MPLPDAQDMDTVYAHSAHAARNDDRALRLLPASVLAEWRAQARAAYEAAGSSELCEWFGALDEMLGDAECVAAACEQGLRSEEAA